MTEVQEQIKNIFIDWFGEERIDIVEENSLMAILVWYPEATVTNEKNDSIHITDLYFKFIVEANGMLQSFPKATRTSFTLSQLAAQYIHSHVHSHHNIGKWCDICTGTSPFADTLSIIRTTVDLTAWQFIPSQLDDFVVTESIEGGPWKRMEGAKGKNNGYKIDFKTDAFLNTSLSKSELTVCWLFVKFLFQNPERLKINIVDNMMFFQKNDNELLKEMTRVFVDFYNQYPSVFANRKKLLEKLIVKCCLVDDNLYLTSIDNIPDYSCRYANPVLTFKGETKYITITGEEDFKTYDILRPNIVCQVISIIKMLYYGLIPTNFDIKKQIRYV